MEKKGREEGKRRKGLKQNEGKGGRAKKGMEEGERERRRMEG